MKKREIPPTVYLAGLQFTRLAKERELLRRQLEMMKKLPHDKAEFKARKKEIIAKMNALTFDLDGKMAEVYRQNHAVVRQMLMMLAGMDFITRLYDQSADLFSGITVGTMRCELLDFVKLCREVAAKANEVVRIIDEPGNDRMSMAYADMEEDIGERLLRVLGAYVDDFAATPEGRKHFYGDHLKGKEPTTND